MFISQVPALGVYSLQISFRIARGREELGVDAQHHTRF